MRVGGRVRALALPAFLVLAMTSCAPEPSFNPCDVAWRSLPLKVRLGADRKAFRQECSRSDYVAICKGGGLGFADRRERLCKAAGGYELVKVPDA